MRLLHLTIKVVLLSILTVPLQGQINSVYNRQVSIQGENDVLAFKGTDGYYTNGLFINYSAIVKKNISNVTKCINTYEIGQKIFTQGEREVLVVTELDRPITGYLFGRVDRTFFRKNGWVMGLGASVGAVGKAALAQPVLRAVHPQIQIKTYWNWIFDYELKSEPGLNLHGKYAFPLIMSKGKGLMDLYSVSTTTLGTLITNGSESLVLRIGKFNKVSESEAWGSRISIESTPPDREFFGFIQPQLTYQAYDATIQGGMFRSDKGRVVSTPYPFLFQTKVGFTAAFGRFSATAQLTYITKEAKSQDKSYSFGGVGFSYKW